MQHKPVCHVPSPRKLQWEGNFSPVEALGETVISIPASQVQEVGIFPFWGVEFICLNSSKAHGFQQFGYTVCSSLLVVLEVWVLGGRCLIITEMWISEPSRSSLRVWNVRNRNREIASN